MFIKSFDSERVKSILGKSFSKSLSDTSLKDFPLFPDTKNLCLVKNCQILSIMLYREIEPGLVEVDFIATQKDYERQGLASRLLRSLHNEKIWLEVSEANEKAVKFYSQLNFKVVGRRTRYYGQNDALLLEKTPQSLDFTVEI